MAVTVKKCESKSDILRFIKLQWKFYQGNNSWVPPLIMDRKKMLDREKNPFFEHAEVDYFIAYKNGEAVGRIAAIKNDLHNEVHKEKTGFFGFFETIDDQEVTNTLLDTVKEWLKKRGMNIMRGPASHSSNDEWGLLIDEFVDPPMILMPYNPPYYQKLLENYGLKKSMDLLAYKLNYDVQSNVDKIKRAADIAQRRSNVKVRNINFKKFNEELELIKDLYNKTWQPNWGFVPLTSKEIDMVAADLKQLAVQELAMFAMIDGKNVGFTLTLPDYNQIFRKMNGRLFPFGIFKLLLGRKKINRCRVIMLGVLPEYQKKGIDAVLYKEITERGGRIGFRIGEASWILEDNEMMVKSAQMMQGERYKTYRVYDYAL
ncbi:MAG: hypothetical protein HUU43_13895 [Ignavibacteriaceae bacterium]|nr:hypothetical protein [Ignavibacteriaceae bacterium]